MGGSWMECRELRGGGNPGLFLPRVVCFFLPDLQLQFGEAASGLLHHHGTVNHVAKVQGCSGGAEQEYPGVWWQAKLCKEEPCELERQRGSVRARPLRLQNTSQQRAIAGLLSQQPVPLSLSTPSPPPPFAMDNVQSLLSKRPL